jgi:Rrf2 family protein
MLKFSKKIEYALISLIDVGKKANGDLVSAKSISSKYQLPQELLGKVLQSLVKKGLLSSIQGVRGGYSINRNLSRITLLEVVEAIEGPIYLVNCTDENRCKCSQQPHCTIKSPMEAIQYELAAFFKKITLNDLANKYIGLLKKEING